MIYIIIIIILRGFVQVVRELQYSKSGVTVKTEDGFVYEANYVILSVSIGVLQSDLLAFNPTLPVRLLFFSSTLYSITYKRIGFVNQFPWLRIFF